MELVLLSLLLLQGVLGGVDTLLNHEVIARLPHRPESRGEVGLHAIREANYALLFGGLAWLSWLGPAAAVVGALILGEIAITAIDEFIENRTRLLPQNERVLHVFLTVNLGAIAAVAGAVLWGWWQQPGGWEARSHGGLSWALTALAVAGFFWSARDVIAWRRLGREIAAAR
jgi:hypothetical protein